MAEHSTLTGAQLHEPKGVASATSGKVYISDGLGSGSWSNALVATSLAVTGTPTAIQLNGLPVVSGPVLLNTLTASNSANLSDTTSLTSTYRYYMIVLDEIVPQNSSTLFIKIQVSGVFQTAIATQEQHSDPGGEGGSSFTTGQITASNTPAGGSGLSGVIYVSNPSGTSVQKIFRSYLGGKYSASQLWVNSAASAYTGSTAAVTGFQILMSAGNITSGTMKIYGYN